MRTSRNESVAISLSPFLFSHSVENLMYGTDLNHQEKAEIVQYHVVKQPLYHPDTIPKGQVGVEVDDVILIQNIP